MPINPIGYPTPIAPSPAVSREIAFYASGTALMWGGRGRNCGSDGLRWVIGR